ncbi:MAG TPA: peptide chain release factor N(5)-glutamine methyltransferase [Balneolaceae bacterium]|nr:peptide chain release factor N(5)-glutamine methyltransferase [Balneolaceae bacterium]
MPKVPSVWTVLSMLEWATAYFEENEVKSPRFSIEWLLADVLSIKRLDLYLEYDRPLSSAELEKLRPLVKRRAGNEPLQYITGETDFYNVKIKVEPGVLIPRQETEELVDWILQSYPKDAELNVLDIGTGSGCIPVALKNERPNWNIYATDISPQALDIAMTNAELNSTEIHLQQDDLFSPKAFQDTSFHLIISNPPYILRSEKSGLDEEVKKYEPELALFCESTEKMYGALEELSRSKLSEDGDLFLELHEDYSEEVHQLFKTRGWNGTIKNDYSGKPRFFKGEKSKTSS